MAHRNADAYRYRHQVAYGHDISLDVQADPTLLVARLPLVLPSSWIRCHRSVTRGIPDCRVPLR